MHLHPAGDPAGDLFFAAAAAHLRGAPEVGDESQEVFQNCIRRSEMAFSFINFFFCCRLFEPDPAAFGSTSEIDCCEKVIEDLLARVVQRKVSGSRSELAAI